MLSFSIAACSGEPRDADPVQLWDEQDVLPLRLLAEMVVEALVLPCMQVRYIPWNSLRYPSTKLCIGVVR